MKKQISLLITLFLIFFTVSDGHATELQSFIDAQAIFEKSLAGDQNATQFAIEQFDHLAKNYPDQPLYSAYLGSAYTLKARDAWMPWTRLKYVEKGLELIDTALLNLRPKHDKMRLRDSIVSMETRLVALSTFLQVPSFLNRLQTAKDLLTETFDSSAFAQANPEVKGRIYLRAAELADKEGKTQIKGDYLQKALNELPEGRFRDKAEKDLAGQE
ncbi:MAG: hypothetical protein GXO96_02210 [Nitrospirae bacterium]|nr:hypothetical protein [Candidatus Manganitrophaceae bacterium]